MSDNKTKFTLICIYALSFMSNAGLSAIAPFFPYEAEQKGVSASTAGAIFSIYGLVLILMNAITGKLIPLFESKVTQCVGIILVGGSNIFFGLLDYIDQYEAFVTLCFIVRIFEAIGCALIDTTSFLILIKVAENNLVKSVGINEACLSIGFSLGPVIGSLIYKIGGYKLPFIVFGCVILCILPFVLSFTKNYKDFESNGENKLNYSGLISMNKVRIVCFVVVTTGINTGIFYSTLELYLRKFEIGPEFVAYMFFILGIMYTLFTFTIGHILTKIDSFTSFCFGQTMSTIGFILLGPLTMHILSGSVIVIIIALMLCATGNAFSLIPSLPSIQELITEAGYVDNVENSSYVSGLWTTVYSLGLTIGPYFGALLFQYYGPEILFITIASINLITAFTSLTVVLNFCSNKHQLPNYEDIDAADNKN